MKNNDKPQGINGLQYFVNGKLVSALNKDLNPLITTHINTTDSSLSISTTDLQSTDGLLYKLNLNIAHYKGVSQYASGKLQTQMTVTDNRQPISIKTNYKLDSSFISTVDIQSQSGGFVNGTFNIRVKTNDTTVTASNKVLTLTEGKLFLKYQQ